MMGTHVQSRLWSARKIAKNNNQRGISAKAASVETEMTATQAAQAAANLSALRELMKKADNGSGVDAYIIPTEDPHMVFAPTSSNLMGTPKKHFIIAASKSLIKFLPVS